MRSERYTTHILMMMPKSIPDAKMPTRRIGKQSMLKEIRAVKRYIICSNGCLHMGTCLGAMEKVADVALLVADDRLNTPEGREAVYAMRRWYVSLRRM